jgi:hypothetical protein
MVRFYLFLVVFFPLFFENKMLTKMWGHVDSSIGSYESCKIPCDDVPLEKQCKNK